MLVCVEDLTHRLVLFLYVLYVEAERVRRPTDKVHFTVRLRLRVLHRRSAAGTWNVDTVVVAIISRTTSRVVRICTLIASRFPSLCDVERRKKHFGL